MNDACLRRESKKTKQPSGKKKLKREEKRGGCLLMVGLEYLKLAKMAFPLYDVHTKLCV